MTATPKLPELITGFFLTHLAAERNVSPHTARAYRDAMKLLLRFAAAFHGRPISRLSVQDLDRDVILAYLAHLEEARGNSVRSRNARLAAIRSFFSYVLMCEPALSMLCQRVLATPFKRGQRRELGYLTEEELGHLLAQIDRTAPDGERDYVLLAMLYDTGARIQELLDLQPKDFRFSPPTYVRVMGKGRKERLCPLLPQTARLVASYLDSQRGKRAEDGRIFLNRHGVPLTRHGALYLLRKYLHLASETMPSLGRPGISPHTFRHTKAMHLLQAGVPLITIKDILGHADLKSTEVYVQTDQERKREALERVGSPSTPALPPARIAPDILAWLEAL